MHVVSWLISSRVLQERWTKATLTLQTISSVGMCLSVIVKLRPFINVEMEMMSKVWLDIWVQFNAHLTWEREDVSSSEDA
jgi:hypothetical protein